MYGCNKLYCEHLGRYFTLHFQQLAAGPRRSGVDFRALRFPGLISAATKPSGGTSDYGPEMLHAAAERKPYACFVDEKARLPFMAMPDAIRSLTMLADAPAEKLTQRVYNVGAFSVTAGEIRDRVARAFPRAEVTFQRDEKRAAIVDSWPGDVDDAPARRDWGWRPDYDFERAFADYLLPGVRKLYGLEV
jgi:nucleoside-diphosphate-sugar epimerase